MNPVDYPAEYDLIVAGTRAPGVCTIVEADDEGNWDDKEASGQEGASTTYQGRKLRAFKTRHSLAVDPIRGFDDISDWEVFVPLLRAATAGQTPVAYDVWHPDLAVQEITAATPRVIGALRHDGKGMAEVEVQWKEHAPPKPKPPKGTSGSKTGSSKDGRTYGDDMLDDAEDELDSLLNEGDP